MDDSTSDTAAPAAADPPRPQRTRWQPLRLGLVELYHYDSEEFHFEDGHLLLRGNNGTGKSKVLSLTLPFLLDADLSPARVEPDADRAKRMDWNLLMGRLDRRTGYAWIEFGRLDEEDGEAEYITLGCGLRATAGTRDVRSWYFVTEQRVGVSLSLISHEQTALTRDRLIEALGSHAVFDAARDYRRAVDERLFQLGPERYRALIDTLIQLRQPQLSKQPNENNLSEALTHALPPLERGILEDVAEAMTQLDDYQEALAEYRRMRDAVASFNRHYRRYAAIASRRRAGDLRRAQTAFDQASAENRAAGETLRASRQAEEEARAALTTLDTRRDENSGQIDALKRSPEMRSAAELDNARRAADSAARAADTSARDLQQAVSQAQAEAAELQRRQAISADSRSALDAAVSAADSAAEAAGTLQQHAAALPQARGADALAEVDASSREAIAQEHKRIAEGRAQQIRRIHTLIESLEAAQRKQTESQRERDRCFAAAEDADAAVQSARQAIASAGETFAGAWAEHIERARPILPADWPDAHDSLADWIISLDGPEPMRAFFDDTAQRARNTLSEESARLGQRRSELHQRIAEADEERARLASGGQSEPPPPATRMADRTGRAGAPLWRVLDFAPDVAAGKRSGIEAALQASALLDAWITPQGELLDRDTGDLWLTPRAAAERNLCEWLVPEIHPDDDGARDLDADRIRSALAGIAIGEDAGAEAWIDAEGRYRVASLQGAWHKPEAEYIGFAAREAARQRRLQELTADLAELQTRLDAVHAEQAALQAQRDAIDKLTRELPDDSALRQAHARLAASETAARAARQHLSEAEQRLDSARNAVARERDALQLDAEDARLPVDRETLRGVEQALAQYREAIAELRHALQHHAQALGEQSAQRQRAEQATERQQEAEGRNRERQAESQTAQAHADELERSVGASVRELNERLAQLQNTQQQIKQEAARARDHHNQCSRALGSAEAALESAQRNLQAATDQRSTAVADFQAFARTGLLRAAVPDMEIPDSTAWTIDPALAIARAVEQELQAVDAGDSAWKQAQDRIGGAFNELNQAMSAGGHQTSGEPGEYGFVVRVQFHQRDEAPDRLEAILDAEIGERQSLLTAKEREIIENHLQAEIAVQLQDLMQQADRRVNGINTELARHPTSTGVKFKLEWQAADRSSEAEFADFAAVRRLLLHTTSDAWSAQDRAAVGAFLQARIAAERDSEHGGGMTRLEQLARALDYRAWHRFRVRRWQDGQWRPLSGPASSGERALGLTVPLFAAASSHYESAAAQAPRLVLLDEAFAGIDDAARAHCMDLVRAFDLDFVMTSEREWGCYAELPGVSICHLIRREGIDAVYVSRWRWNGRQRLAVDAPARATGDTAAAAEAETQPAVP